MLPGKKKGTVLIQLLTAYIDHLTKASRDQVNSGIISLQLLDKLFYARRKPIYQKIEMVDIIPFKLNSKYWSLLASNCHEKNDKQAENNNYNISYIALCIVVVLDSM
jgi:hypothetical protein